MSLKRQIVHSVEGGAFPEELTFTLVFREIPEEKGFVAECLEIPGCVSEGDSLADAEENIKDAVRACLGVMFEDCVREAASRKSKPTSYVGISSQQTVTVKVTSELESQLA